MRNRQIVEAKLQEELLDEISDFSKAITKKIGQGFGAVQGAGQKIKGATRRGVDALGKSFQQGKQQAQKAVAGQDYKKPQAKTQTVTTRNPQSGVGGALQRFGQGVTQAGNYNYKTGTQAQQDARSAGFRSVAQQAANKPTIGSKLAQTDANAKRKAELEKQLGTTGAQAAADSKERKAIQKSIRRNQQKKSAVKKGMDQATKQTTQTAQNVSKKSGVSSAKIGGQKIDLNDPALRNLRSAIEKAAPGVVSSVDKLAPADKAKLKKAIA